jgi:DNA-binding beta-propeller fold protein YncE
MIAKRKRRRNLSIAAAFLAAFAALYVIQNAVENVAAAQAKNNSQAPRFEVDPMWPKPLPNHWLLGSTIGVWVDERDWVWIIHRSSATLDATERGAEANPPVAECCKGAPPVLAFDQAGNLVANWGGPGQGYEWPSSNHGIFVDHKGNVWIGGNGPGDSQILKFTKDGKFLAQYGKANARALAGATPPPAPPAGGQAGRGQQAKFQGNSHDQISFGRVAKIFVDPKTNKAFVADGYLNKRVAVLDGDTGKMERYWGAYGEKPDDANLPPYNPANAPDKQFRNPVHCADVSKDDFVYVCDRVNDRIQVFTKEGKFIKEAQVAKNTLAAGSAWDVAFSKDAQQRFIYLADGQNAKVHILDRQSLQVLTSFGDGGRQPGQFFGVHSIATDSKGNVYTTETYEGKRVQRFVFKGVGNVTKADQGVLWPSGK